MLAGIILMAGACSKTAFPETVPGPLSITAGFGDGIKGYLVGDKSLKWLKNYDTLTVFNELGTGVRFFVDDASNGKEVATFFTNSWQGGIHKYASCSSIPLSEASCTDGVFKVRLDPAQKIVAANSFASNTTVCVGKITGSEGSYSAEGGMKNVNGLVRFCLVDTTAAKVQVTAIGGEALAGTVNVDYEKLVLGDDAFWTAQAGETSSTVVLFPGAKSVKTKTNHFVDGRYYVALLPQTYSKGIKFTVYDENDNVLVERTIGKNGLTINRSEAKVTTKALDDFFPDEVVLDVCFKDGWPFVEPILATADRTLTGDTYHFTYTYGEGKSHDFPFVICKGSDASKTYYMATGSAAYKNGQILMVQNSGAWVALPMIPGRKLKSVEYSHTNGGSKGVALRESQNGANLEELSAIATSSSPTHQLFDNGGEGYKEGISYYLRTQSTSTQVYGWKAIYVAQ